MRDQIFTFDFYLIKAFPAVEAKSAESYYGKTVFPIGGKNPGPHSTMAESPGTPHPQRPRHAVLVRSKVKT